MAVMHSFRVSMGLQMGGRVEQLTAIHRFNILEFWTGLFIGDRYDR